MDDAHEVAADHVDVIDILFSADVVLMAERPMATAPTIQGGFVNQGDLQAEVLSISHSFNCGAVKPWPPPTSSRSVFNGFYLGFAQKDILQNSLSRAISQCPP